MTLVKSKSIDLLKSFTKKEIRDFGEFIVSPYHNKGKRAEELFRILKEYWPEFDNQELSYENIYRSIFKKGNCNTETVRNLLSDMIELMQSFLAFNNFKSNRLERDKLSMQQLANRKMETLFIKKFRSSVKGLERSALRNETYFKYMFEYSQIQLNMALGMSHEYSDNSIMIDQTERAMAEYTAVHLGNFYGNYSAFGYAAMKDLEHTLHRHALSVISHMSAGGKPAIVIYDLIEKMHSSSTKEAYLNARECIYENENLFDTVEIQNFHIMLHNFALDKLNSGDTSYSIEYDEIISRFIEKGYGNNANGSLSQPFFRNAVQIKVRMKHFDDARVFIERYKNKLPPESAEDNYLYSMAYISFNEGNFSVSLGHLAKIKFDEYLIKLQTESLSLMNLYELNMSEQYLYKIESFQKYMKKNKKIPKVYYELFTNFLVHFKRLSNIKLNAAIDDIHLLKKQIESVGSTSKKWLLEKVAELAVK